MDEVPIDFRCPISMELMKDPVTISTGVTYERRSIEKWFSMYNKATCPTTMQQVSTADLTPNHILKRVLTSWVDQQRQLVNPTSEKVAEMAMGSRKNDEIVGLLKEMETTPFKVSSLRKLKDVIGPVNELLEVKLEFVKAGGVEAVVRIVQQVLVPDGCGDFSTFRACEEGLGLLNSIHICTVKDGDDLERFDDECFKLVSEPKTVRAMATMLQRGSQESRYHTIAMMMKISKAGFNNWTLIVQDQGIDFFKSLLDLVSDDMWSKSCSYALGVLIEILTSSKKNRVKAIEAGAMITLIELLPESTRSKGERMLYIVKLLCECPDGRSALVEHGLGVAVVSKKMMNVSDTASKLCVKILWLVSGCHPTERVVEDMVVYGAVKKLLVILHFGGGGSTRDKVLKMFKMHGSSWKRFDCFPSDLKDYLGLGGSDSS